ncbi:MAG: hypothetical protein JNN30_12955 [Rhodanobacteraceae bacterium]|nr:hypothetical protein [Rhodanobacteraceae bacterium]
MKAYLRKFIEWVTETQTAHRFAYLMMSMSYASNCIGADDLVVGIVATAAYLWLAACR